MDETIVYDNKEVFKYGDLLGPEMVGDSLRWNFKITLFWCGRYFIVERRDNEKRIGLGEGWWDKMWHFTWGDVLVTLQRVTASAFCSRTFIVVRGNNLLQ